MTVLDKNLEYRNVLMILPKNTISKEIYLPSGYRYVEYTDSRKEEMASIMCSLEMNTKQNALKELDSILCDNRHFFKEHALCVVDDRNQLVGFAYLIKDDTFKKDQCCIGSFAVKEDNQRNGIARAMITRLSIDYDRLRLTYPLYLKIESYAYVAIAMLARMGFNPFMGAYCEHSEQDSTQDWEIITNILKEKSMQGHL